MMFPVDIQQQIERHKDMQREAQQERLARYYKQNMGQSSKPNQATGNHR